MIAPMEVSAALAVRRPSAVVVVDRNNKPIPCVELHTWGDWDFTYVTDTNGVAVMYEPGLTGKRVSFGVYHYGDPSLFPARRNEKNEIVLYHFAELDLSEGFLNVLRSTGEVTASANCTVVPPPYTAVLDANNNVPEATQLFSVLAKDGATGRALAQVELVSTRQRYVTDNAGKAAIFDRDQMGRAVRFEVKAHGYRSQTLDLTLTPGQRREITLERKPEQIAQRLYRVTGVGTYRDSILLGEVPADIAHPAIDADVMSQDGPMVAVYKGRVHWTFGDTNHPSFGQSNYRGSGGWSPLSGVGALPPERGINLSHFTNAAGVDHAMAPVSEFPEPVAGQGHAFWPLSLTTVRDSAGSEQLYSLFNAVPSGGSMSVVELSVGRFDEAAGSFDKQLSIANPSQQVMPEIGAHAVKVRHGEREFAYFENASRIEATEQAFRERASWQAYTPLRESSIDQLERDATGRLLYRWRSNTPQITSARVDPKSSGLHVAAPAKDELLFGHLRGVDDAHAIQEKVPARDYHPNRKRFTQVVTEVWGSTSALGEVWYAESDTPMGPWVYAKKVITHDQMSFYNQVQLPFLTAPGSSTIYFAGVFGNYLGAGVVPRYNYNILAFSLDVSDPRLVMPVPVYDLTRGGMGPSPALGPKSELRTSMTGDLPAPFFAYDRNPGGALAAHWTGAACRANRRLVVSPTADPKYFAPDFYVLPVSSTNPNSVLLYEHEWTVYNLFKVYAVDGVPTPAGFARNPTPVARVLKNPLAKVWFPTGDYLPELVADAGADICVNESAPSQGASVRLDATLSTYTKGSLAAARYEWQWQTGPLPRTAVGATPTARFAVGNHVVQLRITAPDGQVSVDKVVVDVAPAVL